MAIVIDRAAFDHGQDCIAIDFGICQSFEQHHAASFAPAITVGGRVKGFAATIGRERLHLRKGNWGEGGEHEIDATGQRQVTFTST